MIAKHGERIGLVWDDYDSSNPEYVRGHVTEAEARAALDAWETGWGDGPITIRHKYGRFVFSSNGDYDRELRTYTEPQRGAFKVTEVRFNQQGGEVSDA